MSSVNIDAEIIADIMPIMRIWHTEIIPHLCRQHLLAVWREGLGTWAILTQDKKGYRNHPAVKEWDGDLLGLYMRLCVIRSEMLRRGYNAKNIPCTQEQFMRLSAKQNKPWQTREEQIHVLRLKKCACTVGNIK